MESTALAERTEIVDAEITSWTPRPLVTIDEALKRMDDRIEFMNRVLSRIDGGLMEIPGNDKKALGKPGAEALLHLYGLTSKTYEDKPAILNFGSEDEEPLFMVFAACDVYKPTGPREEDRMLLTHARGVCHSREVKYRYREARRLCPHCKSPAIIKGKQEFGGGWVCFKKQGGCGAKFRDGDQVIEGQRVGRELNAEVADQLNTLMQMADKRAFVAATRRATGWSDLVTEEYEPDPVAARDSGNTTHSEHGDEQDPEPLPFDAPVTDNPPRQDESYILSMWEKDKDAATKQRAWLRKNGFTSDLAKVTDEILNEMADGWRKYEAANS